MLAAVPAIRQPSTLKNDLLESELPMNVSLRPKVTIRLNLMFATVLAVACGATSWRQTAFADAATATADAKDAKSEDKDKVKEKEQPTAPSEDKKDPPVDKKPAEDPAAEKKSSSAPKSGTEAAKSNAEENGKTKSDSKPEVKKSVSKVRLAMLTLSKSIPESSGQAGPFGEAMLDMRETIKRLEKAAKDKSVAGLVLDIQSPEIGRGKVEELRGAISRFRSSGKKVYASLDSAEPTDYLVACACDEIVMPESGELMLPGVYAEAMFYKGLLSKLGVEADFIHIGAYKSYAEPMTNDKFSEPVRENMNSLVDSLYDEMVTTIVKDRPLSIAQAKEVIDTGLISAKRAKELGLIDRVAYPDTLRKELASKYDADSLVLVKNYGKKEVDTDFSGPMGIVKLMQAMMGASSTSSSGSGKKIAVVYAIGPISTGKSESDMFGDTNLGSTTIVEALRQANKDKNVVAIVLRIDSPGGSALASDLIWHETQVITKPIVASMGDVAASGGYYISMGADKIFAAPGTITGSIGVVGGKMALTGLYNKLGITTETIERGKNSGLFSSSGKFSDSQRTVIKQMMEDTYNQFTEKAAKGRSMPVDKLRELAGGRVYTGRQAKENGLVDELGTLHDAVDEAKKLAGLAKDDEVKLQILPEPTNFFESLFGDLEAEKETRMMNEVKNVAPELVEIARKAAHFRKAFDRPAAFVMPFELNIR
jgi:protease-4